jgi:hypothetical protein
MQKVVLSGIAVLLTITLASAQASSQIDGKGTRND